MDLYCGAVITQGRVLALAIDEESELIVVSEYAQAIYVRYYRAVHVYRLFPDFRGGELVLTSRASIDPVGPPMPIRSLVMFSPAQHRGVCGAVNAWFNSMSQSTSKPYPDRRTDLFFPRPPC